MSVAAQREWPTKRLRFLTQRMSTDEQRKILSRVTQVSFLPMEAIGEQGELNLTDIRELDDVKTGYTQFFEGDVVVAKITPCFENGKGALVHGLLNGVGYGTTELYVLSSGPELDGRFLYYVTSSVPFRKLGEGTMTGAAGQKRVPEDFVRDYRITLMPRSEQQAIADYLDRETVIIDELIAAKERLLGLLAEKRRALITHAVTRGINTDSQLHDSNIPWLGDIPVHWETKRVKYLFHHVVEPAPTDNDFELLSLYTDLGVRPRKELEARGNKSTTTDNYWLVRPGDLVVNKLLAWMGAFGVSEYEGVTSPAYDILKPFDGVNTIYYHYLFRCGICFPEFRRRSTGIMDMRLRLYFDEFGDMRVPVPPPDEQRIIVAYIEEETKKIDSLREAAELTIGLLKERRAALISAAVTGKINCLSAIAEGA